jgi:hypothetical protein
MSADRTGRRLLRLYPPGWRARYGEELEALIVEASGGERVPWRTRADVARAAARERAAAAGLGDGGAPGERVRGGVLLVLCAWALFVAGGLVVQRTSEHWQAVTPAADRALPSAAFAVLVGAAACGSVLVVAGAALALPSLIAFLRGGGWPQIRSRVIAATVVSEAAVVATVGLVAWASTLSAHERNGGDAAYTVAFAAWALLVLASLAAWTLAAVDAGRRLRLPDATLRAEAWIGGAVTAAMVAMTVAAVAWWASLASAAPWFLSGRPVGASGGAVAPALVVAIALMLAGVALAAAGTRQAVRALPALRG